MAPYYNTDPKEPMIERTAHVLSAFVVVIVADTYEAGSADCQPWLRLGADTSRVESRSAQRRWLEVSPVGQVVQLLLAAASSDARACGSARSHASLGDNDESTQARQPAHERLQDLEPKSHGESQQLV